MLVQFLGDVAIYVMPYKLDAFNDLRKEIKETVYKVAHAVYALKDRDGKARHTTGVIVLGHSSAASSRTTRSTLIQEDRAVPPANALTSSVEPRCSLPLDHHWTRPRSSSARRVRGPPRPAKRWRLRFSR